MTWSLVVSAARVIATVVKELARNEAVRLFVERAREADPTLRLDLEAAFLSR